jgi:hypothetical protein
MPNFPLIPGRPLDETFSDMHPSFIRFLKPGFSVLTRIPPHLYGRLTKEFVETVGPSHLRNDGKVAVGLGVKEDEVGPLLAAVSVVGLSLSQTEETADNFVAAALKAKVINDAEKATLLAFAQGIVKDRIHLAAVLGRSQVVSEVLPTLTDFETTIDVRPVFEKGQIVGSVPIILVHMDTDASDMELWFQISKNDLQHVLESLSDSLRRVEQAENWLNAKPSGQGK